MPAPLSIRSRGRRALSLAAMVALLPGLAHAYVGPGAGLTAIGTVLALLGAVLLAIVGFVYYPVKRLLRGRTAKAGVPNAEDKDGPAT